MKNGRLCLVCGKPVLENQMASRNGTHAWCRGDEGRATKTTEELKLRVAEAIPIGKENALTADAIQARVGTERERRTQWPTRKIIRELIMSGYPILSKSGGNRPGYWRPQNWHELLPVIESLRAREDAIRQRREKLQALYDLNAGEL